VWSGGHKSEEKLLANAYRNSLELSVKNNVKSIAFPNISTGIYGYPKDEAAKIAVQTTRDFLLENGPELSVTFVCFDEENFLLYKKLIRV
jgi:O-acetyl-ADP-ribose deacetylase (regulator of RNase III)